MMGSTNNTIIARKAYFSSGVLWGSAQQGSGHGYNFTLEAFVRGPMQDRSGLVVNLTDLDQALKSVTEVLDHKHLNHDVMELSAEVLTPYRLAEFCFARLRDYIKQQGLLFDHVALERIRLYQGEDVWVDVTP